MAYRRKVNLNENKRTSFRRNCKINLHIRSSLKTLDCKKRIIYIYTKTFIYTGCSYIICDIPTENMTAGNFESLASGRQSSFIFPSPVYPFKQVQL